jgi:hypothetical protein
MALEDVVDAAEMGEHANGGLAVVAEGLDDAVVPELCAGRACRTPVALG